MSERPPYSALEELIVCSSEFFGAHLVEEAERELAHLTARALGSEERCHDLEGWLTNAIEEADSWKRIALKLDEALSALRPHETDRLIG